MFARFVLSHKIKVNMKIFKAVLFTFLMSLLSAQSFAQTVTDYYLQNQIATDTYVRSSLPSNSFGSEQYVKTGGWGDIYVGMIKFNISNMPTIVSGDKVSLWLHNVSPGGIATPTQINIALPALDFTDNVTWNNTLSYYTSTLRAVNVSQYGYWTEFEITDYYNSWKTNKFPNYGVYLIPVNTNNNFNFFASSSPLNPSNQQPLIRITKVNPNQFLIFPIGPTLYPQGAYTPGKITSILDHNMDTAYSHKDGKILSFTGELFQSNSIYPAGGKAQCYPKAGGGTWSSLLSYLYSGTGSANSAAKDNCSVGVAVNYEAHPGYDYSAAVGTPIRAAAAGTVVNTPGMCIPKGLADGCVAWGAIGVDHGNGYITQYLHLSSREVTAGQTVVEGQRIGLSGGQAPNGGVSPHLHFEVLKLRNGYANNYDQANYATVDPYGYDASTGYADYLANVTGVASIRLWK